MYRTGVAAKWSGFTQRLPSVVTFRHQTSSDIFNAIWHSEDYRPELQDSSIVDTDKEMEGE